MALRPSIAACALLAACGAPPPDPGPEALCTVGEAPYDLAALPWPSDLARAGGRLSVGATGLSGSADRLAALAAALSDLDGAGLTQSVFFPLSGPLDGAVSGNATVVDLTDGDPAYGATRAWPLFYRDETRELVALAPLGGALAEGHRYGCVVAGQPLHPSPAMRDALAGSGPAAAVYAPLAAWIAKTGAPPPSAATVFTTGHPTRVLDAMRAQLAAVPPDPTLSAIYRPADLDALLGTPSTKRPGFGDPNGVVHDAIAYVIHGRLPTVSWISATPGHLGAVQLDDAGAPKPLGMDRIPVTLILPRCNCDYAHTPVVIFQHGINADRSAAFAVANDFARAGYATLASDTLWHGDRLPGNVDQVDNVTGAAGPDGIGDPSPAGALLWFFDFNGDKAAGTPALDARVIRDNFRQAIADLMQVVRLAAAGDLAAFAAADPALASLSLDASHLVYTGESFGSLLGASVLAGAPELRAAVLAVGGGGIVQPLMVSSPSFALLAQPLFAGAFDQLVTVDDPALPPAAQRSLALLETAVEPGDPSVWAPRIAAAGKHALFLQAHADEVMPNQAGDALAAAAGATQVRLPSLPPGATPPLAYVVRPLADAPYRGAPSTIAVVQVEPATHGMFTRFGGTRQYVPPFPPFTKAPSPTPVDNPIELLHALAVGFADSYRAGSPTVIDAR